LAVATAGGPLGLLQTLPTAYFSTNNTGLSGASFGPKVPFPIHFDMEGETKEPQDRTAIANDPGLTVFRDASRRSFRSQDGSPATTEKMDTAFAEILFSLTHDFQPQQGPAQKFEFQGQSFVSHSWFSKPDELIFYWRTKDEPARIPKIEEVKAAVEQAKKLSLARDQARDAASKLKANPKLANSLKNENADSILQTLKDLAKEAKAGDVIDLAGANAVTVQSREPHGGYKPYKLPETLVPNVGQAFVDAILKLPISKPGSKDTDPHALLLDLNQLSTNNRMTVIADDRGQTYYLAILLDRTGGRDGKAPDETSAERADLKQFYDSYRVGSIRFDRPLDLFLDRFNTREQDRYRVEVMKLLRARATTVDENGRVKVDPEFRKLVEGRGDGSD
jgi:hypothetical protein